MSNVFALEEATISTIHAAVRKGRLTFAELTQLYLDRIATFDKSSGLNSIVLLNPDALQQAKELDEVFQSTGKMGLLAGIPVVVKDNYHTCGLQTTAGSIALKGFVPLDNAFQVRRIIEAGGIILCKANLWDWAFPHCPSSLFGEVRNPYDLSRTVAGSSSGTAAAIAANFGSVGLGTDTGNSIRGPSSHAALVGVRSTMGAASRQGIIPASDRYDVGGPMCRTVEDAALVFGAIAGFDPADPITEYGRAKVSTDYTQYLDKNGLSGARIGVFRLLPENDKAWADSLVNPLFEAAISDIEKLGATVVDPFQVPNFWELARDGVWVSPATFPHEINAHLKAVGAPCTSIHEVLDAGLCNPATKETFEELFKCNDPEALRSPKDRGILNVYSDSKCCALRDAILGAMDAHSVDIIVYPTWNRPPATAGEYLGHDDGNNSPIFVPPTGLPALSVPMGYTGPQSNWPAGLEMVGRLFAEDTLFRLAYAYEQGTQHRKPPAAFVGNELSVLAMPVIRGVVVATGN